MAGRATPTTTTTTYSPSPTTQRARLSFYDKDDVDWVRPDGLGFHQCRPAFFRTSAVNAAASGSSVWKYQGHCICIWPKRK